MRFTRTAYTGLPVNKVLAEIVNDAGLNELPTTNSELYSRRHREERPDQVRITVIVERVGAKARKR
jgi:hypothetical protein